MDTPVNEPKAEERGEGEGDRLSRTGYRRYVLWFLKMVAGRNKGTNLSD